MSLTVTDTKSYDVSADSLFSAALTAVTNLEGKVQEEDQATGQISVKFHKTIHGKVLGDRTHFDLTVQPEGDGSQLAVSGYPLNAVGQPLQFGARKGVSRTVLNWIFAHVDHNLQKQES